MPLDLENGQSTNGHVYDTHMTLLLIQKLREKTSNEWREAVSNEE